MSVGRERRASDSKCRQGPQAHPLPAVVEQILQTHVLVCRELFRSEDWKNIVMYTTISEDLSRWEQIYHPQRVVPGQMP